MEKLIKYLCVFVALSTVVVILIINFTNLTTQPVTGYKMDLPDMPSTESIDEMQAKATDENKIFDSQIHKRKNEYEKQADALSQVNSDSLLVMYIRTQLAELGPARFD